MPQLHQILKRLLFPGIDMHTRSRYRHLPKWFQAGPLRTLDAGCGNGALSFAASRVGNRVLGVSLDEAQIQRNSEHFTFRGVPPDQLEFQVRNLYDLPAIDRRFDQIICSEVLEHIRDDRKVLRCFHDLLVDGGTLHLCCPNALHPDHNLGRVDNPEDGGHVRDGYTMESYRAILSETGFEIVDSAGVGSPGLVTVYRWVRNLRQRNEALALVLFVFTLPLAWMLDRPNPAMPYSLYVKAIKRSPRNA